MNKIDLLLFKYFRMRKVTCIIWDFDGTLWYDESLGNKIKSEYIKFINTKSEKYITMPAFDKKAALAGSWSKAASQLLKFPESDIIDAIEKRFDHCAYLKKDMKLIRLFKSLNPFRHFILTNSSLKQVVKGLQKIGLSQLSYFPPENIFSRDKLKLLKPDKRIYETVLKATNLPKSKHLFIGDSFKSDIYPAQQYGFQAIHISAFRKLYE